MEVKRFGTFPVILVKLATPPLPPQTKLNFEQNAGSFAGAGGGGGGGGGGGSGRTAGGAQNGSKNCY